MDGKPIEEVNSQSSQLNEEGLQKLVGNSGNNTCCSSMPGREVNVNLSASSETCSV